ncbi:MAG: tetratricopeptide repeat protein, partial [Bacteroidota bacterium]
MTRYFILLLALLSSSLNSQTNQALDSLEQVLATYPEADTSRFAILSELFNQTAYNDLALAQGYARQIVALGIRTNQPMLEGEGYQRLGIVLENGSSFDSAVYYYEKALSLYHQEQNIKAQGTTLYNMSIVYQREGKYDLARQKLREASMAYAS